MKELPCPFGKWPVSNAYRIIALSVFGWFCWRGLHSEGLIGAGRGATTAPWSS